ncbi:hypothetical protein QC764_200450 [Podospora pseudoanserina]|uniref:NmrA-like domain-containing protein n=1 Tax=Podospora pseudoanserina TaxID=2609844 RepID=A0ABR0IGQ3_9PEZI|nr:hypothetical protein QC764_200450 [Podospora pseudoanserina]
MKNRSSQQPTTMRVAIAGAGGLARILAQYISQTHSVLILSTQPRPEVDEQCPGCQLVVVDYQDIENLRYAVLGADIIISTISGAEQLNLIDAARRARVRRFVPSEFEGDMSRRPTDDPLDRGGQSAIEMLEQLHMRYTIFSCGIFMERFAPGGLQTYHIGAGSGVQAPSDYLVDIQGCNAEIIPNNPSGRSVRVTLTSVYDVAQFVTAAIDLGISNWPREYRMRGETMTVTDLVHTCSDVRGVPFNLTARHYREVEAQVEELRQNGDWGYYYFYYQRLLQTALGRYHVHSPNLNDDVQVQPMSFRAWLERFWGAAA